MVKWLISLLILACASHSYRLYQHDAYDEFYAKLVQTRGAVQTSSSNDVVLKLAAHQKNALQAFYVATGGSEWDSDTYNRNPWNFTSGSDPCDDQWYGIGCSCNNVIDNYLFTDDNIDDNPQNSSNILIFTKYNVECNVTVMVIKDVILKGYIPSAIGQLSTLKYLYISNSNTPYLIGDLPASIGNLSSLVKLSITTTTVTGPLPATIGNLSHLTYLSLWSSKFTSLPDSICGLTNLVSLAVSFNRLKSLPACIGNISSLNEIWAQDCNLATIPNSWYSLTKMKNLYLDTNNLAIVSSNIMQLTNLELLTLGKNRLIAFPPINNLPYLTVLDLSNNKISGELPLLTLNKLEQLLMGNNNFTGYLHSFRLLTKLQILIIDDNSFSGTIIDQFYDFPDLNYFSASNNKLSGPISTRVSDAFPLLRGFVVDNNRLSGGVPDFLSSAYNLEQLDLSSNMFSGNLPFVNCSSALRSINFGDNYFTGEVSSAWFKCIGLVNMDFSDNSLSGQLPDSFDKLPNIERFYGYFNLFKSTIPSTLAKSSTIKSIWLQSNKLEGTIPSFQLATNLEQLFIYDNYLRGSIKFISSVNKMLQNVDISRNFITGHIDDDLLSLNSLQSFSASSNCLFARFTEKMCNGSQLTVLILDGIHSACAVELPKIYKTVYASINAFSQRLPACLFEIPTLQQLHLSGNSIDLTLPATAELSQSFKILQLSNNDLRGVIPDNFQSHSWSSIRLSSNKLGGSLSEALNVSKEIYLGINRLSGHLPHSLFSIKKVDVLDSNFFDCSNKDLHHFQDHAAHSYDCGSDTVNTAAYSFAVYIGLISFILGSAFLFKIAILHDPPFKYISKEIREKFHDITLKHWTDFLAILDIQAIILRTKGDAVMTNETRVKISSMVSSKRLTSDVDSFDRFNTSLDILNIVTANHGNESTPSLAAAKLRLTVPKRNRDGYANIDELVLVLRVFRQLCYILCTIIIVVTLPLYIGLSYGYSMYILQYFFTFSIAYLSGVCPAVLLFFFALTLVVCFLITDRYLSVIEKMGDTSYKKITMDFFSETSLMHKGSLIFIGIVNFVAVSVANTFFVFAHNLLDSGERKLLEIGVALFKVIWVNVVYRMLIFSEKYYITQKEIVQDDGNIYISRMNIFSSEEKAETSYLLKINTQFLTYVTIFNNLMIPALAVMILSTKCFKSAIFESNPIESSYSSYFCKFKYFYHSIYEADLDVEEYFYDKCSTDFSETMTYSYMPPYIYTYECSSSILRSYCPVFMYEVLMLAMTPVFQLIYVYLYKNVPYVSKVGKEFLDYIDFLPTLVTTIIDTEGDISDRKKPPHVFEAVTFMVHMVSLLSILLTFGLAFPPLGLITAFAIVMKSFFTQLQLGYFITECLKVNKDYLLNILNRNLKSVVLLLSRSIRAIFVFMVSFFGIFLFDIVGDSAGYASAVGLSVVFISVSLILNYSTTWIANNVLLWYDEHCNTHEDSTVQSLVNWCQKYTGNGTSIKEVQMQPTPDGSSFDQPVQTWVTNPLKSLDSDGSKAILENWQLNLT